MIYRFDDYVSAYPTRNVSTLKKFVNEAKNLHEMSTAEINAITEKWEGTTPASASNMKSIISQYFNWCAENNISVAADVNSIVFPKKTTEFLIYSSEMLHEYWEKYLKSCEREAVKTGDGYNRARFLVSYAASILSFYGMTCEQILDLNLSDVQPDGIIGYDLPLTKADIDVLLEYKNLTESENHKKLTGYKYVRSAGKVSERTLNNGVNQGNCETKDKYLKAILTFKNTYVLGRYAEIYAAEKSTGELVTVDKRAVAPKFFTDRINLIVGKEAQMQTILAYKREYVTYRSERMVYESKNGVEYVEKINRSFEQLEKTQPKPVDNAELKNALSEIDFALAEIEVIKKSLLATKAKISKLVK